LSNQKATLAKQSELKKLRNLFFQQYCPDTVPSDTLLIKALSGLKLKEDVFYEACRNLTKSKSQVLLNVADRFAVLNKCKKVYRGQDQRIKDNSTPASVWARGTGANKSKWRET
jgi:hypothetical protein